MQCSPIDGTTYRACWVSNGTALYLPPMLLPRLLAFAPWWLPCSLRRASSVDCPMNAVACSALPYIHVLMKKPSLRYLVQFQNYIQFLICIFDFACFERPCSLRCKPFKLPKSCLKTRACASQPPYSTSAMISCCFHHILVFFVLNMPSYGFRNAHSLLYACYFYCL
jgi:hypothetical protein